MPFRLRPSIKIGNARVSRRGVSVRTGIPGVTFRHEFSNKHGQQPLESKPFSLGQKIVLGFLILFAWAVLYAAFA